jgi:hypothetical protein
MEVWGRSKCQRTEGKYYHASPFHVKGLHSSGVQRVKGWEIYPFAERTLFENPFDKGQPLTCTFYNNRYLSVI